LRGASLLAPLNLVSVGEIILGVTQLNGAVFWHGCLSRLDSISRSRRYSGPS
jgi:hypothetical protein